MPLTIPRDEKKVAQAREMYVPGLVTAPVIARRLGVSKNTVYRWLDDEWSERDRIASRAAKDRRTGICQQCGGTTRYNGNRINGPSLLCVKCSAAKNGRSREGNGPRQRDLLQLLEMRGEARFMEITRELGITKNHAGPLLDNAMKKGLVVRRRRGVYALPGDKKRAEP